MTLLGQGYNPHPKGRDAGVNCSKWRFVDEQVEYDSHAAYEVRLVNRLGKAIPINRFLGTDEKGILSIGMTTGMEKRRRKLFSGLRGNNVHSEAHLLFLLTEYSRLQTRHRERQYQLRFLPLGSRAQAKKTESRLIKDYVKRYGEVPPLNSAIPNRNDDSTW